MLDNWLDGWVDLILTPVEGNDASWDAASKIYHNRMIRFDEVKDDLTLNHCGYTKTKISLLRGLYFNQSGIDEAKKNWDDICRAKKYNSTSFHSFNHLVKSHENKSSFKRMSVMGPCMNSFILTWAEGKTTVDVFYRTTEYGKKFPADLIFIRDTLLPEFDLTSAPLDAINFHFCNITVTPMYSLIPMICLNPEMELKKYIEFMEEIKEADIKTFYWMIKWHARYTDKQYWREIKNFDQARQVHKQIRRMVTEEKLEALNGYIDDNHPGFRNEKLKKGLMK